MKRNSCPHCQQEAMSQSAKIIAMACQPIAKLVCKRCGEKLSFKRLTGLAFMFPAIAIGKLMTVLGLSTIAALVIILVFFIPAYGSYIKFTMPSSKNEGIEW